jgi:hypothetical protein
MLNGNEMGCMKQQPPVLLNYVEKGNSLHIILDMVDPIYIVEAQIWWVVGGGSALKSLIPFSKNIVKDTHIHDMLCTHNNIITYTSCNLEETCLME